MVEVGVEGAGRAKTARKLIPVLIEPVPVPFGFGRLQTVEMLEWSGSMNDERWSILRAALSTKTGNFFKPSTDASAIHSSANDPRRKVGFEISHIFSVLLSLALAIAAMVAFWAQSH